MLLYFDFSLILFFIKFLFLQSLIEDQDLLFGPQEVQSAALVEASLKKAESELTQVRAELFLEKEQRALMEIALNTKVSDVEKVRESALKVVAEAQSENSDLKRGQAGEFFFHCFNIIVFLGSFFSLLSCFSSFSSC